jgi:hypothetical protein
MGKNNTSKEWGKKGGIAQARKGTKREEQCMTRAILCEWVWVKGMSGGRGRRSATSTSVARCRRAAHAQHEGAQGTHSKGGTRSTYTQREHGSASAHNASMQSKRTHSRYTQRAWDTQEECQKGESQKRKKKSEICRKISTCSHVCYKRMHVVRQQVLPVTGRLCQQWTKAD